MPRFKQVRRRCDNTQGCRILWKRTNFEIPNEINTVRFFRAGAVIRFRRNALAESELPFLN